ncbi:hypothetical protein [Jeotgalibacillus malaysiensis]|uniref:hypothetical protein n=1 Tax=Jeotgalibacillus malaysiensis TaxID=1508404 RepID=UPI00384DC0D1
MWNEQYKNLDEEQRKEHASKMQSQIQQKVEQLTKRPTTAVQKKVMYEMALVILTNDCSKVVLDLPAGSFKSVAQKEMLAYMIKNFSDFSALVVAEKIETIKEFTEYMETLGVEAFPLLGKDNYSSDVAYKDALDRAKVARLLVVTTAKFTYKSQAGTAEDLINGRSLIWFDERPDLLESLTVTEDSLTDMRKVAKRLKRDPQVSKHDVKMLLKFIELVEETLESIGDVFEELESGEEKELPDFPHLTCKKEKGNLGRLSPLHPVLEYNRFPEELEEDNKEGFKNLKGLRLKWNNLVEELGESTLEAFETLISVLKYGGSFSVRNGEVSLTGNKRFDMSQLNNVKMLCSDATFKEDPMWFGKGVKSITLPIAKGDYDKFLLMSHVGYTLTRSSFEAYDTKDENGKITDNDLVKQLSNTSMMYLSEIHNSGRPAKKVLITGFKDYRSLFESYAEETILTLPFVDTVDFKNADSGRALNKWSDYDVILMFANMNFSAQMYLEQARSVYGGSVQRFGADFLKGDMRFHEGLVNDYKVRSNLVVMIQELARLRMYRSQKVQTAVVFARNETFQKLLQQHFLDGGAKIKRLTNKIPALEERLSVREKIEMALIQLHSEGLEEVTNKEVRAKTGMVSEDKKKDRVYQKDFSRVKKDESFQDFLKSQNIQANKRGFTFLEPLQKETIPVDPNPLTREELEEIEFG